jgi:FolB domain-containing protein
MTTDQTHINDLLLRTVIGVNEEERRHKQDLLVSITFYTDHTAATSDDIADVVDYRPLIEQTITLVENSRFFLLEKLAMEIALLCLADPRIERVVVTVEKPAALRLGRSVAVTVDRTQADLHPKDVG